MDRYLTNAVAAVTLLIACPVSHAGPDFVEGSDAGSSPVTAVTVMGTGFVSTISGALTGGPRGAGDYEDVYLLRIADPANFSATTIVDDMTTDFDTQLFLFDGMSARGLVGNLDRPPGQLPPGSSELLPQPEDGVGPGVTEAGVYYLAINGAPEAGGNPTLPVGETGGPIFAFATAFEISGPDGNGGQEDFTDWAAPGQTGNYLIFLTGCEFIQIDTGACCIDQTCFQLAEPVCLARGGTYEGSGTQCSGAGIYGSFIQDPFVPDNDPTGITDGIRIADSVIINEIEFRLDMSALRVGDVIIQIQAPFGVTTSLLFRVGSTGPGDPGDDSNLDGDYTFTDNSLRTMRDVVEPQDTNFFAPPGAYRATGVNDVPVDLNGTFGGSDAQGDWVINVIDVQSGQQTVFRNWAIILNGGLDNACSPCACEYGGKPTTIDVNDLTGFLAIWFATLGTAVPQGSGADVDGNGIVEIGDLLAFLACWYPATAPGGGCR